ncbi:MAG TPA: DinB family protein [Gemmatimonadaceae bacterium]|nr:DinB family protein [Gemmatimonadaceae bacterium]
MRNVLETRWSDIGDKLVALAESVPEESYDYRPVPEIRTFAEQLRHVAYWNDYLRDTLRGDDADGTANEISPADYPGKAEILPALRESFEGVRAEFSRGDGKSGSSATGKRLDQAVSYIDHVAEHYGQLVVYARLSGVIPPASLAEV